MDIRERTYSSTFLSDTAVITELIIHPADRQPPTRQVRKYLYYLQRFKRASRSKVVSPGRQPTSAQASKKIQRYKRGHLDQKFYQARLKSIHFDVVAAVIAECIGNTILGFPSQPKN